MKKAGKALIFDTSTIITLALNNLLFILKPLKKEFGGEFYMPGPVKKEIIDKSMKIKRFILEALMIKDLVNKGIFTVVPYTGPFKKETQKILEKANTTFQTRGENIRLLHEGEAGCLALYSSLETKNKAIVIDERTTRMLCEAPQNLAKLLGKKLHARINVNKKNFSLFKNFKIIRSSELCFIAYKKRIIELPAKPKEALRALLYATKYRGCAISHKEVEIAQKL